MGLIGGDLMPLTVMGVKGGGLVGSFRSFCSFSAGRSSCMSSSSALQMHSVRKVEGRGVVTYISHTVCGSGRMDSEKGVKIGTGTGRTIYLVKN